MAKGQESKDRVKQKIIEAFGADYVGEFDKKLYVWTEEGGQRSQVCIAMTCPKVFKGEGEVAAPSVLNFEDEGDFPAATKPVEVTPEEKESLQELMNRLGL